MTFGEAYGRVVIGAPGPIESVSSTAEEGSHSEKGEKDAHMEI